MTKRIDIELASMEQRLSDLRMSPSERLVAVAAMRNGLLIVEGCAWLRRKVTQIGTSLFSKPQLAR